MVLTHANWTIGRWCSPAPQVEPMEANIHIGGKHNSGVSIKPRAVQSSTQPARGTGARFGDSFGLGREALLMGHNCPVFDRCQPA